MHMLNADHDAGANVEVRQVVDISEMKSDDGSDDDCMVV